MGDFIMVFNLPNTECVNGECREGVSWVTTNWGS